MQALMHLLILEPSRRVDVEVRKEHRAHRGVKRASIALLGERPLLMWPAEFIYFGGHEAVFPAEPVEPRLRRRIYTL